MARQPSQTASQKAKPARKQSVPLTFIDHIHELRGRLFWVVLWFVVATGAIFPFFQDVIQLLMRPLGHEKLYYLTPIGGLSFMFKVCMYVGFIATIPILLYHLYRFIAPVVRKHSSRQAFIHLAASFLLAMTGIVFAYLVSLPAAMHFLTHFGITGVSPMLTVDSYLSFIISYLLAGALLFQLPLIMVIIDSIRPTPPSQWGKYERHMIVAAFVIAMLITPTPNITDQVIMAVPIILMYQVGIGLVYLRRHRTKRALRAAQASTQQPEPSRQTVAQHVKAPRPAGAQSHPSMAQVGVARARSMDSKRPVSPQRPTPQIVIPRRSAARTGNGRSIDGMVVGYTT